MFASCANRNPVMDNNVGQQIKAGAMHAIANSLNQIFTTGQTVWLPNLKSILIHNHVPCAAWRCRSSYNAEDPRQIINPNVALTKTGSKEYCCSK
jgi:hypothetical protein